MCPSRERIGLIDADVVCLQEVSPLSFENDFAFMDELGYDAKEMFKKGRFRPATFWKTDRVELVTPPMHKDRTLLTSFKLVDGDEDDEADGESNWHVLNCHLQAGKQGGRRVRQVVEGVTTAFKTAKNKLKEREPEKLKLVVCGDFNGGDECGAVNYIERGSVGPDFVEDGEAVASKEKVMPIPPLRDATKNVADRPPPPTLVVPELISLMIEQGNIETAYMEPQFSQEVLDRLHRIYSELASHETEDGGKVMNKSDAERWLTTINLKIGRGSEFRSAAKRMGWVEPEADPEIKKEDRPPIFIPDSGTLSKEDFVAVYLDELRQGKFWGVAWDLAALGEPLDVTGVFEARYDRMYCSESIRTAAVLDTVSSSACPNKAEPSDHLPVAATFISAKS